MLARPACAAERAEAGYWATRAATYAPAHAPDCASDCASE